MLPGIEGITVGIRNRIVGARRRLASSSAYSAEMAEAARQERKSLSERAKKVR